MNRSLIDLLDGMLASADRRLAPDGADIVQHFLLVARRVAEAEVSLGQLGREPTPFEAPDLRLRVSGASYAVVEAALAYWGLAVRLRARFTGAHAARAAEPLNQCLRTIAGGDLAPADGAELLGNAARALLMVSPTVEAAQHDDHVRSFGTQLDGNIEQFAAVGVISLLRIAAAVQEESELR